MRGFRTGLACVIGIGIGAAIGQGLFDGHSVLSTRQRSAQAESGRDDSINLPAGGGSLLAPDVVSLTYPGGNTILATRNGNLPPIQGYSASSMALFYRFEDGTLQLGCGGAYHTPEAFILEPIDIGEDEQPITLTFKSPQSDVSVPATLARRTDRPGGGRLRLITVKGDDVQTMLTAMAVVEFPGRIALSFSTASGPPAVLDNIPTTGAVRPAIDAEHQRFAQPPSDPLKVVETFCRARPG